MAVRARPGVQRRRLLQAAGAAGLAGSALASAQPTAPAAVDDAAFYLAALAARLQMLRPDLLRLGARLRAALPAATLASIIEQAERTLRGAVGPVLASAEATVPGLIADDFEQGRVIELEGIVFSHTELALLGALDRARARVPRG
jgi:hypothetical protein